MMSFTVEYNDVAGRYEVGSEAGRRGVDESAM